MSWDLVFTAERIEKSQEISGLVGLLTLSTYQGIKIDASTCVLSYFAESIHCCPVVTEFRLLKQISAPALQDARGLRGTRAGRPQSARRVGADCGWRFHSDALELFPTSCAPRDSGALAGSTSARSFLVRTRLPGRGPIQPIRDGWVMCERFVVSSIMDDNGWTPPAQVELARRLLSRPGAEALLACAARCLTIAPEAAWALKLY